MTTMLEAGQVLAARYELQRSLARNRVETWLARDRHTLREVVVTTAGAPADESAEQGLQQRHAIASQLHHPALRPAGQLERSGDRLLLIDEYLEGGDLTRLRGRPWPFVLRRVVPVIEALQVMHDAGWVHGDVKPGNVLLDADGLPQLADFGSARAIGAGGPAETSPYAMSPQRFDGAPAAITDDVYAVGAMIHELVSGHPPFYPDITEQRVRSEAPPLLGGRPAVPPELANLVAGCLAKDPASRPQSMAAVATELRACLAAHDGSVAPPPLADELTLRPPLDPAPIRPNWARNVAQGPSAGELRSEGFRRGVLASAAVLGLLALVGVFFVLPGYVAKQAKTAAPSVATTVARPAPPPAVDEQRKLEQLAQLKLRAEQQRAQLTLRIAALEQRDFASWAGSEPAAVRSQLAAVDAAFARQDYAAALTAIGQLEVRLRPLEQQWSTVLATRRAAGLAALEAGRAEEARTQYQAALRVDARDAQSLTGLRRAQVLDRVLAELAVASQHEQRGDTAGALAAYRRALALDPATRVARDGVARLQTRKSDDAYAVAMSEALAAGARKDASAAREAYAKADRIRPGSSEAAEGLRQLDQAARTRDLGSTLTRAREAERAERWADALAQYRGALKLDPALLEAQQGVERCDPRAMVDAQLQAYVDRPERLFTQDGRNAARSVLERAARIAPAGPRLESQRNRVAQSLQQAETPMRIALASDNLTDVQIYRIGRFGTFERREVELLPGRYTAVGTRSGYRDVRREFTLLPGAAAPLIEIRCQEPI